MLAWRKDVLPSLDRSRRLQVVRQRIRPAGGPARETQSKKARAQSQSKQKDH